MADQFDFNSFNSFIQQANNVLGCNSECQQKNKAEQLKQDYLNSQTNLASADSQVQTAQKNYLTFTEGELGYNQVNTQQLNQKAVMIIDNYKKNFNTEVNKINLNIESYNVLLKNSRNVFDLYLKYKNENIHLYKKLKNDTSDVLTNERKSYYEEQGINSLKFYYYYILLLIYSIVVLCYGVFSFIYPSSYNWTVRFFIFVFLIILPFVSSILLDFAISLFNKITGLLPTNVHLTV
jgi:hypothetical protein